MTASPLAQAADALLAAGFHVLPILPPDAPGEGRGKAPGEFKHGRWLGMGDWPRYRDRAPTDFELRLWRANWPAANVGIVLGSPIGALRLLAVDIDTTDADEFDEILRALPHSPMRKRAAKGETLFYAAPAGIKSRGYKVAVPGGKKRTLVDLLTGNETRQTVVPPSIHPEGPTYVWTAGPVPATDLPVFDEDALAVLEETLAGLGWGSEPEATAAAQRAPLAPRDTDEPPTVWRDLNDEALGRLGDWVPALDLHGLRPARGGYEAVPVWRSSSTGQPLEKRKKNLKIHPTGIRDMGDDRAFTPLDLIQQTESCDLDAAFAWLSGRLGKTPMAIELRAPPRVVTAAPTGEIIDAETGEVLEAGKPEGPGELPDRLTRPGGLVEEITDWICATARRPSRAMAVGAALTIVGTVCGRQFSGPTRTGTHLYVLPLAPTSAGKDHPANCIMRCMTQAKLGQHVGPSQFISMPAAIKFLTRSPLSVCPMDEFGDFLKRINNRRASGFEGAISGVMRTAWGRSFAAMTTPEWAQIESRTIHAPAMSIFGTSTPEEFYASLASQDATNGVMNRFLILGTARRAPEQDPEIDPGVVPPAILEKMRALYYAKGEIYAASLNMCDTDCQPDVLRWADEGAHRDYIAFGRDVERRSDADTFAGAFLGRTAEMAQRVATIVALGREGPAATVSREDMAFGRDLALWSAETMIAGAQEHMSENDQQQQMKLVLGVVRKAGTISRSDLMRRIDGRLNARDLDGIIKGLIEAERMYAAQQVGANGGRPRTLYVFGEPPVLTSTD